MDKSILCKTEFRHQIDRWIKNDLETELGSRIEVEWEENSKCITLEERLLDQCKIDWLKS